MGVTSEHVTGFAIGAGAAALGFYLYKKNQDRVDCWLRQQGLNVPTTGATASTASSVEELVREKERLEDLIAEREMQSKEQAVSEES